MQLNYFNFKTICDKILLTNDFGEYAFVTRDEFKKLIAKQIDLNSPLGKKLIDKHMVYDTTKLQYSGEERYRLRSIKRHVNTSTSLHIFVVTTACNMQCIYCQANNGKTDSNRFMDKRTAEKAVDIALQSPTRYLSFEFQGGEPLLNFPVIKHIVEYTERNKKDKCIGYNLVSNLTLLNDEILTFLVQYKVGVSTSVDGNRDIHNQNRTFRDRTGTFDCVKEAVARIRDAGLIVGAIETTTRASLAYPEEIVQTYVDMGFDGIFLRPLTPLGRALVQWDEIGYTAEEYIAFYKKVMEAVIAVNKNGKFMKEDHSAILLKRLNGQFINYMELRSPCGAGIGQLAYYADGNVFTCDEGRMLYEMGDAAFCLGNVFQHDYNDLIQGSTCRTVCISSILEGLPSCCDCVYQPYCGTCPVINYALDGDLIEKHPHGFRCQIYSGMLDYLFELIEKADEPMEKLLYSWTF